MRKNNTAWPTLVIVSTAILLASILIIDLTTDGGISDTIREISSIVQNTWSPSQTQDYYKLPPEELIRLGTDAANDGRYSSAEMFYGITLEKKPEISLEKQAKNGLGYVLTEQNRIDESQKYYEQVLELDSDNINANIGLGYAFIKSGAFEKSISFFHKALEKDSRSVNAYNGQGLTFTELGDYSKAIEMYEKSLKINENNVITNNGLADTYYRMGQYDKAENYYQIAKSFNENNSDTLQGLINVSIIQDKPVEDLLKKASEINQFTISQMIKDGNRLYEFGEHHNAFKIFDMAHTVEPDNLSALYGMAKSSKELKRYIDAEFFVDEIIKLDGQHIGALSLKESLDKRK